MHLKKGSVIENVKYHYRDNLGDLITQADITDFNFSEDIRRTIELTEEVFGSLSSEELSDINHKQYCWKNAHSRSKRYNYYDKRASKISIEEMKLDLEKITDLIIYKAEEIEINDLSSQVIKTQTAYNYLNRQLMN